MCTYEWSSSSSRSRELWPVAFSQPESQLVCLDNKPLMKSYMSPARTHWPNAANAAYPAKMPI